MLPVAADGTCRAPESSAKTNRMKQHAKRVIAFYLPQYHPFPENDRWWGAGFTEWRNVVKARPLFRGHYQPHLPADLGFYDLRVPEVRQQQAALAERYGLSGFCYYHYWFNGHRLMQRPVEEMLASGKPDFPFMLCWANENWTRAWDGGEQEVLIRQEYSEEDDRAHIRYLLDEVFRDPRYIRVDGKPVFAVYRSALFPDMRRTIEVWREEAAARGVELYLCRVESFNAAGREELAVGFDAAIEFQPFTPAMTDFWEHRPWRQKLMYHLRKLWGDRRKMRKADYDTYVAYSLSRPAPDYKLYPSVTPSWDNTARRKQRMFLFHNATPEKYGRWLREVLRRFKPYSAEENFVFINAWNEWAEGNHLEPDMKWGGEYLAATLRAIEEDER